MSPRRTRGEGCTAQASLRSLLPPFLLAAALPVHTAVAAPGDTVFLLLVDGSSYQTVSRLYGEGRLPSLARLTEGGRGGVVRTVTSFPSSTAPSLTELFIGDGMDRLAPAAIARIQDFDREDGRIRRYEFRREDWDSSEAEIFDRTASAGLVAWNYYPGLFRGASINWYNGLLYKFDWLLGYSRVAPPHLDQRAFRRMRKHLRRASEPPALVFATLDNADVVGHVYGPQSPEYEAALVVQDALVGRLVDVLQARTHPRGGSWFDHTWFYVFGDHGMAGSGVRVNLADDLQARGIEAADSGEFGRMLAAAVDDAWYGRIEAVVLGIGSNVADVYVRPRGPDGMARPWRERPTLAELRAMPGGPGQPSVDVVGWFLRQPGVSQVLAPDGEGRVRVFDADGGEALVAREGPPEAPRRFAYQPLRRAADGHDPLEYTGSAAEALLTPDGAADLVFHDASAWFEATVDSRFPFAPALLPKAFRGGPRAPDLVVNASLGYSFLPMVRGDHGNLERDAVTSFLLVSGPAGCQPAAGRTVRLIDLHAEVLQVLGIPLDPSLDSQPMHLCAGGAQARP